MFGGVIEIAMLTVALLAVADGEQHLRQGAAL